MTQLLQMTVQGTLLIAVLLLLRTLFRRRISPVILYALWLLPAARLLIPGSVESAFSLQNFVPASAEQGMATVLGQGSAQVPQLSQAQTTLPPAAADLAQQAAIPSGAALDVGTLLTVSMYYDGGQEDTLSCVLSPATAAEPGRPSPVEGRISPTDAVPCKSDKKRPPEQCSGGPNVWRWISTCRP